LNASRKRTLGRVAIALVLLALLALAARGCAGPRPAAAFTSSPVTRGPLEVGVLATGTIEAARLVSVGTQATGEVKRLHVSLGDKLKKGDLIAEIDAKQQENELLRTTAALRSARADLASRQAVATQAGLAVKRARDLAAIDAGSHADLEAAEATAESARANVIVAQAAIAQAQLAQEAARLNLAYARVVAPMDGTVVAVVTEQGQTVNSAQVSPTIVKLARLDAMTIRAQISEADVPKVKVGMRVRFTLLGDPETVYETVLRAIEPGPTTLAADTPATPAMSGATASPVYYNGIFDVPNPKGDLRIAMTAQATIVTRQVDDALLIPSAALGPAGRDGRYAVQVLADPAANGAGWPAQVRQVRIGLNNRTQAQVLEGLALGERVVTSVAASGSAASSAEGAR
jgi:membrane fusion protein, macrolide-specific efflux system